MKNEKWSFCHRFVTYCHISVTLYGTFCHFRNKKKFRHIKKEAATFTLQPPQHTQYVFTAI